MLGVLELLTEGSVVGGVAEGRGGAESASESPPLPPQAVRRQERATRTAASEGRVRRPRLLSSVVMTTPSRHRDVAATSGAVVRFRFRFWVRLAAALSADPDGRVRPVATAGGLLVDFGMPVITGSSSKRLYSGIAIGGPAGSSTRPLAARIGPPEGTDALLALMWGRRCDT